MLDKVLPNNQCQQSGWWVQRVSVFGTESPLARGGWVTGACITSRVDRTGVVRKKNNQ